MILSRNPRNPGNPGNPGNDNFFALPGLRNRKFFIFYFHVLAAT
jgi:hypothetical protein